MDSALEEAKQGLLPKRGLPLPFVQVVFVWLDLRNPFVLCRLKFVHVHYCIIILSRFTCDEKD